MCGIGLTNLLSTGAQKLYNPTPQVSLKLNGKLCDREYGTQPIQIGIEMLEYWKQLPERKIAPKMTKII